VEKPGFSENSTRKSQSLPALSALRAREPKIQAFYTWNFRHKGRIALSVSELMFR
jgi:hypothetical protein